MDRPDVLSSDALAVRARAGTSFSFTVAFAVGLVTGAAVGFEAGAAAGGVYLAVLR